MQAFNKTRFKQAYQIAMSQQAAKRYREMSVAGTLKDHLSEVADEAQLLYEGTVKSLEGKGMGNGATFIAAEIVFAELIQFPDEQGRSGIPSWLTGEA